MATVIEAERPDTLDATALIRELDAYLEPLYPAESRHGFAIERLLQEAVAFFVVRHDGMPAGCGGIKLFGTDYGEIKRMYVRPQYRKLGLGTRMLQHLAHYAWQRGVTLLRLETGIHQPEALASYERFGFRRIPPFGNYREDPVSLCYEKRLTGAAMPG